MTLTDAGELAVAAPWGTLIQTAPISPDGVSGAAYQRTGHDTYGLSPVQTASTATGVSLVYSTYLGGGETFYDFGYGGVAVDGGGSAYVTGTTNSAEFPTANPFQAVSPGYYDAFVTKLSPSGGALVYSTYLGGSGFDYGYGIAVDGNGSAYITGYTGSTNFPTANPLQAGGAGNYDAFVTKLSASGASLAFSTHLGGSDIDVGEWIAVDGGGSAYVTGYTQSLNFPTENPLQAENAGGADVFVAKLSPLGQALTYGTYLGGTNEESGWGIAVDGGGSAYITGPTNSTDFPTAGPMQASMAGYQDAFVAKLSPSGLTLAYSTYLGGSGMDNGYGIAVDANGSAYVTGVTGSADFPTANPLQPANAGGYDAFVTKLSASGFTLAYSTFLGGGSIDGGYGIAVDGSENAYVTGPTSSIDFPTASPLQTASAGGEDAFVTKLSPSGTALVYSTYLGGSDVDYGYGIAVDESGRAYVTGATGSTDFPTANPFQSNNAGAANAFISKLGLYPCDCPCAADPECDSVTNVLDAVGVINVAFRAQTAHVDGGCAKSREDVDCDGTVDVIDVIKVVNVAFRAGNPAQEFCNPCS